MKKILLLSAGLAFLLAACEVKPAEINYGTDACHFCKMTIVDRQHAAQVVTVKGKPFKYDAIECMMNDLAKWDGPEIQLQLASDYASPGALIDARSASYLISKAIPSPMGRFLSAFEDEDVRDKTLEIKGGKALNWDELRRDFLSGQVAN